MRAQCGVFLGATTLAIAQALPADGKIYALDTEKAFTDVGAKAWQAAGVAHKVDLRIAPAADSLKAMIAEGLEGSTLLAVACHTRPLTHFPRDFV